MKVKDIRLLTIEEAKAIPENIRQFYNWWWLQSPGLISGHAACVSRGGSVDARGRRVYYDRDGVRPALEVEGDGLAVGQEIEHRGVKWVKAAEGLLLCNDDSFGFHRFDEKSNGYDKSEIKQYIEDKARELGIISRDKDSMTVEEAIRQLQSVTIYHGDECTREALDMAIDALEKQIGKPVIRRMTDWECPTCHSDELGYHERQVGRCKCGQALIWGE